MKDLKEKSCLFTHEFIELTSSVFWSEQEIEVNETNMRGFFTTMNYHLLIVSSAEKPQVVRIMVTGLWNHRI